ncbi:MAG: hypothetical protein Q8K45_05010 [Rubrivivax sp.]|nr:hypothetical protein [Rubrivivax sp.]
MKPSTMKLHLCRGLLAAAALLAAAPAGAVEASWSGFATLGYARSDSDYTYQGSINKGGTLRRDSLLAGQLDLRLAPQWSATVQAQIAPAEDSDTRWRAKTAWAFVAWRPNNDWLLRAGKVRVPLYLYSESLDVGVASDMARLPHEMYSIAPTNDFTGLFVTRNFSLGPREFSLEAYSGQADATLRLWRRDGTPPQVPAGPYFRTVDVQVRGLLLTVRDDTLTWRLGAHRTRTASIDGSTLPVRYPRVEIGPGLGYWQVDDALPGPGLERIASIRNLAVTAGLEWHFGDGWRVAGEVVRMRQKDTELGSDSKAGYIALFKRIGAFTPYFSMARQRSSDGVLGWRTRLTGATLPAFIPGATQLVAAQRVGGESVYAFDQGSRALGVSYALSPTTKLKGEWMRTRIGAASAHFDTPPGQPDPHDLRVNTLSLNLSLAF